MAQDLALVLALVLALARVLALIPAMAPDRILRVLQHEIVILNQDTQVTKQRVLNQEPVLGRVQDQEALGQDQVAPGPDQAALDLALRLVHQQDLNRVIQETNQ